MMSRQKTSPEAEAAAEAALVEQAETAAETLEAEAAGEAVIEGALSPPFITVEHAGGQQSIIPVDFGCTVQVIDPFGVVLATVGLGGVTGIALEL